MEVTTISNDEQVHKHTLVYAGLRPIGKWYGHVHYVNDGSTRAFKVPAGHILGGIYEVEGSEAGDSLYMDFTTFKGMSGAYADEIPAWRTMDKAAKAAQEADRAEKRLRKKGGDLGDLTLRELKELMRGKLGHQRAGLVAAAISYLNSGY